MKKAIAKRLAAVCTGMALLLASFGVMVSAMTINYVTNSNFDVRTLVAPVGLSGSGFVGSNIQWSHNTDAQVGDTLQYRIEVTPGKLKTGADSHNLILSNMLGRISPDYSTMKVEYDGKELTAGQDYRLYVGGERDFSDDMDPEHMEEVAERRILWSRIQKLYCPYYTFGLIFDNAVFQRDTDDDDDALQLLGDIVPRMAILPLPSMIINSSNRTVPKIIVTFQAKLDENAYLASDITGYKVNAKGAPTYAVDHILVSTLGWTEMDEDAFNALVHGAGEDVLPRFEGARDVDIGAIERTGMFDGGNTSGDPNAYTLSDSAHVYNYGFDIVKTDEGGRLLSGAAFEVRMLKQVMISVLGDMDAGLSEDYKGELVEFVPVNMRGLSGLRPELYPESLTYRIATADDLSDVRVTQIPAGCTALLGLTSGDYTVTEVKAPSGYKIAAADTEVKIFSAAKAIEDLSVAENMGPADSNIRDTDMVLQQQGQSMLGEANQGQTGTSSEDESGEKVDYGKENILLPEGPEGNEGSSDASEDAAAIKTYEEIQAEIRGLRAGYMNLCPIQVNGDGYDLSDGGLPEKCVFGFALFHKDASGRWAYGDTSGIPHAYGAQANHVLSGDAENPLQGGVQVVNKPVMYLPATGGMGVYSLYFVAAALTLLGLAFGVYCYRKHICE